VYWTIGLGISVAALVGLLLVWAVLPGPGAGRRIALDWPAQLGAAEAAARLRSAGIVDNGWLMALYLSLLRPMVELEPGPHVLNDALSPRHVTQRLARVPARPAIRLTFPEGWNHVQIGARLEEREVCTLASFRRAVHDRALLRSLRIEGPSAEGYLFPATYDFPLDSDPHALVRILVRETRERIEALDARHSGALQRLARRYGFREYQLLTLASIIEREATHADERRTIASVFYNRLSNPEFRPLRTLQSDPTAGYGCVVAAASIPSCAGYDGRVTPAMLRDAANPYNTYRHPGLPPGPIANPGEASIVAALTPQETDFLYFMSRGGGRHAFSRTYEEHNQAVQRRRDQLNGASAPKRR
jgi:UPF0755 protein